METSDGVGGNYATIEAFSTLHKSYAIAAWALQDGEWPLWNALENAGMPLLANYQSAVFYPLRLLHVFLPLLLATTVYVLLNVWLCGFNAYLFGRGIGMSREAARFLSVAWMAGGFAIVWCYWTPTNVAAWFPIVFLGTEWLLRERYRKGFGAFVLGATMFMLAGQPEIAFVFALGLGMYFLLRVALERRTGRALWLPITFVSAGWAVILVLCSVQLLPFLEYLQNTVTAETRMQGSVKTFQYAPSAAVAMWVSRFFGSDTDANYWHGSLNQTYLGMLYAGTAVWICFPLAFLKDRQRRRSHVVKSIALLVPATVLLLLAWRHPALDFLNRLPLLDSVVPMYYAAFPLFALALTAAIGVENWRNRPPSFRSLVPSILIGAVIIAIVIGYFSFQRQVLSMQGVSTFVARRMLVTFVFFVGVLVVLALHIVWNRPRFLAATLTLLLAVDLIYAAHGYHHTVPSEQILFDTALTDFLQEQEAPSRVCVQTAGITLGLFPLYGIETWMGYEGMYPRRITEFRAYLGEEHALGGSIKPACAITHYLYVAGTAPVYPKDEPACLTKVATLDGIDVYENLCAMPRAYLAARTLDIPDKAARFSVLSSSGFNPRYTAVIEEPLPGPAPSAELSDLGFAEVLERSSTHVRIRASSQADCVLVLADAYYPGWKATVDGERVEVFPVNHAFRGILMPEGEHTIEFRYFPASFLIGLVISVSALLISGAAAFYLLWRMTQTEKAQCIDT
ncbi:MAG: YfhO family protein [Candidatus Hydrogenedentota bacterium]